LPLIIKATENSALFLFKRLKKEKEKGKKKKVQFFTFFRFGADASESGV